MPIVSSQVIADTAQADGSRTVTEAHTDHLGVVHRHGPMCGLPAGYDAQAGLAARAALINAQLIEAELAANINEAIGDL